MPLQTVEPLRLYRQIAGQIAGADRRPANSRAGARLPAERELATLLGVSRTSVREAIISLEIAGRSKCASAPASSSRPRPARPADAAADEGPRPFELLDARKLIEGEIAALAARNAKPADLAALRADGRADDARTSTISRSARRPTAISTSRIARATGNGSLELVVEGLWNQRAELWGRMQQHFHTRSAARSRRFATTRPSRRRSRRATPTPRATAMHRHLGRVAREFQRGVTTRRAGKRGARAAHARASAARGRRRAHDGRARIEYAENPRRARAIVAPQSDRRRALR